MQGVQSFGSRLPSGGVVSSVTTSPSVPALAAAALDRIALAPTLPVNEGTFLPAVVGLARKDRGWSPAVAFLGSSESSELDKAPVRSAHAYSLGLFAPRFATSVFTRVGSVCDSGLWIRSAAVADTVLRLGGAVHQRPRAVPRAAYLVLRPRQIIFLAETPTLLLRVSRQASPRVFREEIGARTGAVAVATFPVGCAIAGAFRVVVA